MNYIHQINAFWKRFGMHEEISPTGIAVYFALLHLNNLSGWKSQTKIDPREIMNLTMIGSVKTLYLHLNKLQSLGLIHYRRRKNQYQSCFVILPHLYLSGEVVKKNLPEQGNGLDKARKQQLPEQSPEGLESTTFSGTTKPVNSKTSKPQNENSFLLNDLEKELLLMYQLFIKERTGLPAKLIVSDRNSLRNIAEYLLQADKNQPLAAWKKLLSHWEKLSAYYQTKISLEQIDKNFLNLLDQIENYDRNDRKPTSTPDHRERSHAHRKDFSF